VPERPVPFERLFGDSARDDHRQAPKWRPTSARNPGLRLEVGVGLEFDFNSEGRRQLYLIRTMAR
jgi:hypothetical protein